ncbi:MAG: GAF domain-containing protein, partial [Candidatus Binatota bacterium]
MNLKEICQTLSREIQKLVPYDRLAINLLEKDEIYVRVYAEESRLPASAIPEGLSVREGTATGWVLDHKEPLICRDVLKDPRFPLTHKRYKNVGLRSYVILPLMVKGKALGALNLGSLKPRCYGKKEIKILSPIAEILSLAVENSNLYQESERREEIQKLLKELSQDITSLAIDSLLKKLTEKVREVFKVDICEVRVLKGDKWSLMGISGGDPNLVPFSVDVTVYGRLEWIIENRRPLMIADSSQEGSLPPGETVKALGVRGYLGVPLFSRGGEVIGVLRALTYQPREFAQEEVDLIQQLANGAAIAVENSRLLSELTAKSQEFESANRRLDRLLREQSSLREIFTQINLLDLDTLLHQLTERAVTLLPVDHAQVRLVDTSGILQTMTLAGAGSERFRTQVARSGTSRSSWVMENRRPMAIKDISQEKIYGPGRLMREMGVKGYICVPLIARSQKSIGVLQATSLKEREFTQEEIALAQQLAAGAAVAIENARLFEEVQKKSQELEEAYKTKSAFLNTMAHELRTPLNVLIATMQLFRDGFYGALSEKHITGFEPMERNARNLLDL